MLNKLKAAKDAAVDKAADVANTNIDRAVAAKNAAVSMKDGAVHLKERVEQDGIAKVSSEIASDAATSVKEGVKNTALRTVSAAKSAYKSAKDMNFEKAKMLMKNEVFSRITHSRSAAKPPVLLATAELEITLQACRDEIAQIVQQCKQAKTKYTDTSFPATVAALYADVNCPSDEFGAPKAWKRISDIKKDAVVFKDKPQSLNIDQGDVGTCFLLGSLGVLANEAGLIEHLFVTYDVEVGVYGVRFFINDYWRAVIIDDYLPVNEHGVICYGASKDRDEFWVALIEKAYAKLHMCYQNVDGGVERYAMCDITGGVGERFDLTSKRNGINVCGLWKGVIREGKVGLPVNIQLFISFLGGKILGGGYTDDGVFDIEGEVDAESSTYKFTFKLIPKAKSMEDEGAEADTSPVVATRIFTGKYNLEKLALIGDWKEEAGAGNGKFELTMFEKKAKKQLKGSDKSLNMFSDLWDIVRERSKEKVLMTCAIEDVEEQEFEKKLDSGLLKNHAYGITAIYEINGNKLLRIMNPHGRGGKFNGRWSAESAEMNVVYKKLLSVTEEDNGVFFMCYEDFINNFTSLGMCVLFNEDWQVSTIRGVWRTVLCGGEEDWVVNPQACLTLSDKSKVIVKLSQPTPKIYSGMDRYPIGIGFKVVYCKDTIERITDESNVVVLATVEPQYERSVNIQITLPVLDKPYFIVPFTSQPGVICPFTLSIYATSDFQLVDLTHNVDPHIPSGLWKSGDGDMRMQIEFEAGGCIATHDEDEQGEFLLSGGFLPDSDTNDVFTIAFQKEYPYEMIEELHLFTGKYTKKQNTIEGTFTISDLDGNTISEQNLALKYDREGTFMAEIGLMIDIITGNLQQYGSGVKRWFEDLFPFFDDDNEYYDDEEVDGASDPATVKGRNEMARVKGRAEVSRAKGRSEMSRVKGRAELARAKGRAQMARIKGRAEVSRVKGRAEVARVKGRSEVTRAKGRSELVRVKGRNDSVRLPDGSVEVKAKNKEIPANQVPVVISSGCGCGSKVCIIQ